MHPDAAPRALDPARAFEELVSWIARMAAERECPGLVVGISGTDSALAFLAAARAFERLGRPERVLGIHYAAPWPGQRTEAEIAKALRLAPDFAWVQRTLMPWLAEQAPGAALEVDASIPWRSDHHRWAALFERSLAGNVPNMPLEKDGTYWVMGTRNRTEEALGTYGALSAAASVQPLVGLWKSEVLRLCGHLGVPAIAVERSRQVDCDCGRFELASEHIEEVDWILMSQHGLLEWDWIEARVAPDLSARLEGFVDEQQRQSNFKALVPYRPEPGEAGVQW